MKSKSAAAVPTGAASKREARADDVLAKLKKRARLEERLLPEPLVKEKKKGVPQQGAAGDEMHDGGGEDVTMSSTLQAAKVIREGGAGGGRLARIALKLCQCLLLQSRVIICRLCCFDNQALHTAVHPLHYQLLLLLRTPLAASIYNHQAKAPVLLSAALCPRVTAREFRSVPL